MAAVNPYLNFSGNCEEAFDFYKSVFGGDFVTKTRFADAPSEHSHPTESNHIMHVSLPIGEGTYLFGSDTPAAFGPATAGKNFSISVNADNEEEAKKLFDGLSAGGQVMMPLGKVFWGALFGMFTDKFGVAWMVNCDDK